MYRKAIHVIFFFIFFLPYLQNHGLLRSRNFVIMVTWRNDFSSLLETYKLNRSIWFYASTMSRILSRENDDSFALRYLTKSCSCGLSRLTGLARLTKYFLCKKFNMFIWISLARFPITHVSQLKIALSTSNITAALVKKKFKHDSEYVIPNPRQRLVTLTKVSRFCRSQDRTASWSLMRVTHKFDYLPR